MSYKQALYETTVVGGVHYWVNGDVFGLFCPENRTFVTTFRRESSPHLHSRVLEALGDQGEGICFPSNNTGDDFEIFDENHIREAQELFPEPSLSDGDFEVLSQDEIAASRLAEPVDGFAKLSQIEVEEARRSARLAYEALAFTEKFSRAGNGSGIFEVNETDEELLAEFESQFGDDGCA